MFRSLNRNSLLVFAGLAIGIVGLLVQWAADPAKFAAAQGFSGLAFPPGILFIMVAGLVSLATVAGNVVMVGGRPARRLVRG